MREKNGSYDDEGVAKAIADFRSASGTGTQKWRLVSFLRYVRKDHALSQRRIGISDVVYVDC